MSTAPKYGMFSLESPEHLVQPYALELQLDDKSVLMEVDIGASLSIMFQSTFKNLWPRRELQPSNVKMKTYTEETLAVLGSTNVEVMGYGDKKATLPLLIVGIEGHSLLERNWLKTHTLDWPSAN